MARVAVVFMRTHQKNIITVVTINAVAQVVTTLHEFVDSLMVDQVISLS